MFMRFTIHSSHTHAIKSTMMRVYGNIYLSGKVETLMFYRRALLFSVHNRNPTRKNRYDSVNSYVCIVFIAILFFV